MTNPGNSEITPDNNGDGSLFEGYDEDFGFVDTANPNSAEEGYHTAIIVPEAPDEIPHPIPQQPETEHPDPLVDLTNEFPAPATAEHETGHEGFKLDIGYVSIAGPLGFNQDAAAASNLSLVVADGVGGAADGGIAAKTAVEAFVSFVHTKQPTIENASDQELTDTVKEGVNSVVQSLNEAQKDPNVRLSRYAATTLSAVVVRPPSETDPDSRAKAQILTIGDSPVMLVRSGQVELVTKEQTLKDGKTITNHIATGKKGGRAETQDSDQYRSVDLMPGDILIAYTDGLAGDKPEEKTPLREIARVASSGDGAQEIAHALAVLPREYKNGNGRVPDPNNSGERLTYETKADDITVGVIVVPDKNEKRRLSAQEIIGQQPENEQPYLETFNDFLSTGADKSRVDQILDSLVGSQPTEAVEHIKQFHQFGYSSDGLMDGLRNNLGSNPDLKDVESILLSDRANIANNLAAIKSSFSYLVDIPLPREDELSESIELHRRLKTVRGLLASRGEVSNE